jgi:hypothetical protein
MNEDNNLIYNLVELAISLAQSHLDGSELENTLIDLVHKSIEAFEDLTGKTLDPDTLLPETTL